MSKKITHSQLKIFLDNLYETYDFKSCIAHDPISAAKLYKDPKDIEISAFIASCFAYGKVSLFLPVITNILSKMGNSPYDFIYNFNIHKDPEVFEGIYYRFNKTADIVNLISSLYKVLKKHGTLGNCFYTIYKQNDFEYIKSLYHFVLEILNTSTSKHSAGFNQLLPLPTKGATKRLNLFMRWMVRDKDIDFGIWDFVQKDNLIIPLDTHISRIAQCLSLTDRKAVDWKMALQITENLKTFDPIDPIKYDFALCHQGISQICSKGKCEDCKFLTIKF